MTWLLTTRRQPGDVGHIGFAVLALLVATRALAFQPPLRPPQPFDPLTPAERKQAEDIARADARVKALLGTGRTRLVYVDFIAIKPAEPATTPDSPTAPQRIGRRAEVVFYRNDGDFGVRAVVDLEQRAVQQVTRLESIEVPLNTEDLAEALALALRNDAVRALLGADAASFQVADTGRGAGARNIVRGLRVIAADNRDSCWQHRCVQLFFRRGNVHLVDTVFVDLTTQQARVERGQR
jgi:hypothetical protein